MLHYSKEDYIYKQLKNSMIKREIENFSPCVTEKKTKKEIEKYLEEKYGFKERLI